MKEKDKISKLKKKTKDVFSVVGYFLLLLIITFILTFVIANALVNLKLISLNIAVICTFSLSFLLTTILTIIHFIKKEKNKKTCFRVLNFVKYYILYMIIMDLAISIKSSIEITMDEAKNLIGIELSLFAILTALVVTWCVITEKEIDKNKLNSEPFGVQERKTKIINDYNSKNSAKNYFWDIIPFCINLTIISTIITNVYINKKLDIFTQTLLYYNLHLLLYSMIIVVLDILSPTIVHLFIKKNQLFNDKILIDEINKGMLEDEVLNIINDKCQTLKSLKSITKDEKIEIAKEVIKNVEYQTNNSTDINSQQNINSKKED